MSHGGPSATETSASEGKAPLVEKSKLGFMGRLVSIYGLRFLVMTSICAHWNKGFGKAHQRQTFKMLMTQGYKIHGATFDTMEAISLMPAALAPAFTILSEFFPIGGYHKLYYLFLSLIVGTAGLAFSAFMPMTWPAELCTFGIFLGQFAWMACDSFSQGLYSAKMSKHPESGPDLVMFVWIGQQATGVLASLVSGMICEYVKDFLGYSGLQWSTALLIIPTGLAIYPAFMNWLEEEKVDPNSGALERIRESFRKERVVMILSILFGAFAMVFVVVGLVFKDGLGGGIDREVLMIVVTALILFGEGFLAYKYMNSLIGKLVVFNLICRFSAVTITGAATHFYLDNEVAYPAGPHFSKLFVVTWCGVAGYGASTLALPIYNAVSKKMRFRPLYFWLIVLAVTTKLSICVLYARVNEKWFGISDTLWMLFMTIITRVTGLLYEMPQNLLMSRACPKSLGTTSVAMIGSSINFAFNANKFVSGAICKWMGVNPVGGKNGEETDQFENLWLAAVVISCIKLTPLLFIWLVPNAKTTEPLFTPDSDFAKSALKMKKNKDTTQNKEMVEVK